MDDLQQIRIDCLSSFLYFTRFFFKLQRGNDFIISHPVGSQSHFYEMAQALEDVFHGKILRLAINCPPGWSKSEMIKKFICWSTAWNPQSRNLYISYSHELASSHTHDVKKTMSLPMYKRLFNVEILRDSSAKDFFQNNHGGAVAAFGSSGAITGRDAGLPGLPSYSGGLFIDDIHKPEDIHSDVIREKVKRNYIETIETRLRGINVPIVVIGQRLHQDDLFSYLLGGGDGNEWTHLNIKALDDAGNARYPEVLPLEKINIIRAKKRYVFASQYMQDPIPAGGGLFQIEDFQILDDMPDILATFITVDSAETEKEWNDKTAFSFWGIYKIKNKYVDVPGLYGLHVLDCVQLQIEPKDIEAEFLEFWATCMMFKVKPQISIIEKKSSGVTLVSVLKKVQGLKVLGLDRTSASGSKGDRFVDMQQYIAGKQISLPYGAKHTKMYIDHMSQITANNTHRFDDICDTTYDAIKAAFIDKIIITQVESKLNYNDIASKMALGQRHTNTLRTKAYGSG